MALSVPSDKHKATVEGKQYTAKQLANKYVKLKTTLDNLKQTKRCNCCGRDLKEGAFYPAHNRFYKVGVVPVCKDCIQRIIYQEDANGDLHKPTKNSLIKALAYINKPFYSDVYENVLLQVDRTTKETDFARLYIQTICRPKYSGQTFDDSDFLSTATPIALAEEELEKDDRMQMAVDRSDCIDILNYDPFAAENPSDKPFLYSSLIRMLDANDEDVDVMKAQSCVSITRSFLQIHKLDNTLTRLFYDDNEILDSQKQISDIESSKSTIFSSIQKMASESCISLKNSRTASKGDGTWTKKIKQIKDMNLTEGRINGFDIATCKAMKQCLDLSHQSILETLSLEDSDYADMVKEQRSMIKTLREHKDMYAEAFRLVLKENLDLKKLMKEKGVVAPQENLVNISEIVTNINLTISGGSEE